MYIVCMLFKNIEILCIWIYQSFVIKYVLFSDICQLRLDFDNFDITESTTAGTCTDSFAMTGPSGQNPLNLCGTLTDFHSEQNYF